MIPVVMPQMGESLTEGTLVRWLKAPGDRVVQDEPLFEISTDKVDTDVPAPISGVLREILVREGETVNVNTTVATIEPASQDAATSPVTTSDQKSSGAPAVISEEQAGGHFKSTHAPQLVSFKRGSGIGGRGSEERGSEVGGRESKDRGPGTGDRGPAERGPGAGSREPKPVGGPTFSSANLGDRRPAGLDQTPQAYSPAVLAAAQQGNVPLSTLTSLQGSGRGGRLTKRDVQRYLDARPGSGSVPETAPAGHQEIPAEYLYRPSPEDRVIPMSPARRRIAHHMTWSARISPQATAFGECDMSHAAGTIERHRGSFDATVGAPLTYTVLAAYAAVRALREFPSLNASVVGEAIVVKPRVNLGVAVALPETDELIVPVVSGADELSLPGLARAIHDVATRARSHRLQPRDVQGGTFTLTNPGVFGGLGGTPLLNQPQVAILGLGAIAKRAVVIEDAIAIRPIMMLSLTFDHRAADGMVAFRYLESVRRLLEQDVDVKSGTKSEAP